MAKLDTDIAARFHAGDLEALRQVAEKYQNPLFRLGMKLLGNQAAAADFCQDTFLRAYEKRHLYDCQRPFDPWFFQLAINLGRERWRRKKELLLGDQMPEKAEAAQAEEKLLKKEERKIVQQALTKIKPKFRESLALRFETDLSLKEMAGTLGISLGTVKSRLSRALVAFRKAYLEVQGGEIGCDV